MNDSTRVAITVVGVALFPLFCKLFWRAWDVIALRVRQLKANKAAHD